MNNATPRFHMLHHVAVLILVLVIGIIIGNHVSAGKKTNDMEKSTFACNDGIDNDGDGFVDFPSDPECVSASGSETDCSDTDNGIVPTKNGVLSGSIGGIPFSTKDSCYDSNTLIENYCENGKPASVYMLCTDSHSQCVNGECV